MKVGDVLRVVSRSRFPDGRHSDRRVTVTAVDGDRVQVHEAGRGAFWCVVRGTRRLVRQDATSQWLEVER